jgi:hypothetical protein
VAITGKGKFLLPVLNQLIANLTKKIVLLLLLKVLILIFTQKFVAQPQGDCKICQGSRQAGGRRIRVG